MNSYLNITLMVFYLSLMVLFFYDEDKEKSPLFALLNIIYFIESF